MRIQRASTPISTSTGPSAPTNLMVSTSFGPWRIPPKSTTISTNMAPTGPTSLMESTRSRLS